jgi:hypothetical protein
VSSVVITCHRSGENIADRMRPFAAWNRASSANVGCSARQHEGRRGRRITAVGLEPAVRTGSRM